MHGATGLYNSAHGALTWLLITAWTDACCVYQTRPEVAN